MLRWAEHGMLKVSGGDLNAEVGDGILGRVSVDESSIMGGMLPANCGLPVEGAA